VEAGSTSSKCFRLAESWRPGGLTESPIVVYEAGLILVGCTSFGGGLASADMSTFNAGDPTPTMMVLGLVVQRSDTVAGVARRLSDQFASARFSKATAYNRMPALAKDGYLRIVEKGPPGEPTLDRYEATRQGVAYFRWWLRNTELPPIIRDGLQCRLEFLQRDDLQDLIRLVNEEETAYTTAYAIARKRALREQRSRRIKGKPKGYDARLRSIRNRDEATLWGMMSKRLERLGEELEELLYDMERDSSLGGAG
jgi:DNA-binding PadR family transcriptional regulator